MAQGYASIHLTNVSEQLSTARVLAERIEQQVQGPMKREQQGEHVQSGDSNAATTVHGHYTSGVIAQVLPIRSYSPGS